MKNAYDVLIHLFGFILGVSYPLIIWYFYVPLTNDTDIVVYFIYSLMGVVADVVLCVLSWDFFRERYPYG